MNRSSLRAQLNSKASTNLTRNQHDSRKTISYDSSPHYPTMYVPDDQLPLYQGTVIASDSFDGDKFVNSCESFRDDQARSQEELYIRDQANQSANTQKLAQERVIANNNLAHSSLERKSPFTRS